MQSQQYHGNALNMLAFHLTQVLVTTSLHVKHQVQLTFALTEELESCGEVTLRELEGT